MFSNLGFIVKIKDPRFIDKDQDRANFSNLGPDKTSKVLKVSTNSVLPSILAGLRRSESDLNRERQSTCHKNNFESAPKWENRRSLS